MAPDDVALVLGAVILAAICLGVGIRLELVDDLARVLLRLLRVARVVEVSLQRVVSEQARIAE